MAARIATALLFFIGVPATVQAQFSDGSTIVPAYEAGVRQSEVQVHGEVGTETIQYPTKIAEQPELSQNNRLQVELEVESESSRALSRFQVQAAKSINLNEQYFAIQELYSGTPGGDGFYFGRKLEFWNQADQDWNLGLWQPLYQGDTLRPLEQGLTGFFYVNENASLQFTAFVSPFFIPTMGSEIVEKNGSLVADSRWVRPFPSQVTINGAPTSLTYKLDVPTNKDLVLQASAGARLRIGARDQGPWGSLAYANKPINALAIKYDAALVSGGSGVTGSAAVTPLVIRHHLFSADLGFNAGPSKYAVSAIVDQPIARSVQNTTNSAGFQTDYFQQQPKPLQVLAVRASSTTEVPYVAGNLDWTMMALIGKNEPTADFDVNGIERSQMVPYRLLFTNAISLQGEMKFNPNWKSKVRYLRDFDQHGSLWNVEAQYKPWVNSTAQNEWVFHAGFDVLGVDDQRAQESDTRFLNYYRQNDRVYGGVDYVF